jgi:hypothetical protein
MDLHAVHLYVRISLTKMEYLLQLGSSPYAEPIFQYGPAGIALTDDTSDNTALLRHINVFHGYQLSQDFLFYFIDHFLLGRGRFSAKDAFQLSEQMYAEGNWPIMLLQKERLKGKVSRCTF